MKVILTQNVDNLGKKGDVRDVAEGYARNFLLPRKLVQIATAAAVEEAEIKKEKERKEKEESLKNLRLSADSIRGRKIIIKSKEKNGTLFGKVGAKEIIFALKAEKISMEEKNIILEKPIKKTGEYKIKLKLAPEVETEIVVKIQGEK